MIIPQIKGFNMNDEDFINEVTKHIIQLGWCGFEEICDGDEEEAHELDEGGWLVVHEYVSDMDIDDLRIRYSYLEDEE